MNVYERLMSAKDFDAEVDSIMEEFFATCKDPDQARAAHWNIQMILKRYKDPIARMNKMVELFWQGVAKFEGALRGKLPANQDNIKDLHQ